MSLMKARSIAYRVLVIFLLLTSTTLWANSVRIFNLSADSWARPRAGGVIPNLEPIRMAVTYWETGTDAAILLSYPGEDSGELWASELKDWLISLGIPSDYILLSPGSQAEDEIHILVGNRQELVR